MSGNEAIMGAIKRIIALSETVKNEWDDSGGGLWDDWGNHMTVGIMASEGTDRNNSIE